MGRPSKWSGPTTAIRVPEHLAEHLIDIARQLDSPALANNVQKTTHPPIHPSTIAQDLAEGWISHKLPDYPMQMLTSESQGGTYRLFLGPPRKLPPKTEASLEDYADRVFDRLTECERVYVLARLVEELGERVDD